MSFCRWADDDFQCDLYVFGTHDNTYTIHVAGNRVVYKEPLPEPVPFDLDHVEEWVERHKEIMARLEDEDRHERVYIGLPHAGESFYEATANDAADRVEELLALGYKCPPEVVSELREQHQIDLQEAT